MPDRIEPPRFDRLIRRARLIACAVVVFVILPLSLLAANRGWLG